MYHAHGNSGGSTCPGYSPSRLLGSKEAILIGLEAPLRVEEGGCSGEAKQQKWKKFPFFPVYKKRSPSKDPISDLLFLSHYCQYKKIDRWFKKKITQNQLFKEVKQISAMRQEPKSEIIQILVLTLPLIFAQIVQPLSHLFPNL